jgi:5-methylthioribose kinase
MLDIEQSEALIAYLQRAGYIESDEEPEVVILPGGVSNRTVLVRRASGEAWVIKQALEKLRVQVDWYSSPMRIHREAAGLRWLSRLAPAGSIVSFIFEDHEDHILAMEAVPDPHHNWKTLLLEGDLQLDHIEQFGDLLGTIHKNSHAQRDQIAKIFDDRDFFDSLRLEPYYAYTAEQVPEAAPFLQRLIEDTLRRRFVLVHGDYSPKNVLVFDNRLILLDHEVIHFGDPAFDLGFSMTHLLSKAHRLVGDRDLFVEAVNQYWRSYDAHVRQMPWYGDLEAYAVQHTLACLLARVEGRSPLEYLNAAERARQRETVLRLSAAPPTTVSDMVTQFIAGL